MRLRPPGTGPPLADEVSDLTILASEGDQPNGSRNDEGSGEFFESYSCSTAKDLAQTLSFSVTGSTIDDDFDCSGLDLYISISLPVG